jgi:tetratricopeptide (TPR) repeat protein
MSKIINTPVAPRVNVLSRERDRARDPLDDQTFVGVNRFIAKPRRLWDNPKTVELSDHRHFEAAKGWLGLGDWHEANEELKNISPQIRILPEVLQLQYVICERAEKFESALEIARTYAKVMPDETFGWSHIAFALEKLNRTREARDTLLSVVDKFPEDWLFRYRLACYECQLGNLKAAWGWLERTFDLRGSKQIKSLALEDNFLEPLWAEIRRI